MSTPPTQSAAYSAAMAAQAAATTAANSIFINDAANIINDAISQGKYQIFLNHIKDASFKDISTYFRSLGYTVGVPRCPSWEFGYFYGQYWIGWRDWYCRHQICACGRPCKILISWAEYNGNQYGPCPWPG